MDALNIINYVISIIFHTLLQLPVLLHPGARIKKGAAAPERAGARLRGAHLARNEQAVIGNLLDSIARQTYERGSVDGVRGGGQPARTIRRAWRASTGPSFREVRHLSGRQGLRPCLADGAYRRALPRTGPSTAISSLTADNVLEESYIAEMTAPSRRLRGRHQLPQLEKLRRQTGSPPATRCGSCASRSSSTAAARGSAPGAAVSGTGFLFPAGR